jgi:hypothetical protein
MPGAKVQLQGSFASNDPLAFAAAEMIKWGAKTWGEGSRL